MKSRTRIIWMLLCAVAFNSTSCSAQSPWIQFARCASTDCVKEALDVKDAFLANPEVLLKQFNATYQKGDDTVIGWLYLMRDSVLTNSAFASIDERFQLQQALLEAARPFENDPVLGEITRSVVDEISMLAIASEYEDGDFHEQRFAITGTYSYDLSDERGSGKFEVAIGHIDSIYFRLEIVGSAPAYNQGFLEGRAAYQYPNIYEFESSEYGSTCKLQFAFIGDAVEITTLEGDSPDCGFGNRVTADGTYARLSFDDPFLSKKEAIAAAKLIGRWVSEQDPESEVVIQDGLYTDFYNGQNVGSLLYQYYPQCPAHCNPVSTNTPCIKVIGQDEVCYVVVKADGKSLHLSMINGDGSTLTFKRKGK